MSTEKQPTLRILHLSDTHLFGDDTLHYGIVDTRAALRRTLARAGELDAVDVVVLSGDLSDDGSPESYRRLREDVDPFAARYGAAVVYAPGNHDLRDGFRSVLGPGTGVVTVRGFRIIHLDSSVPEFGYGAVDAAQLAWLGDELREPAPNGSVVVVHHPPVPAFTPLLAALELQHPAELLRVCAEGDVRLVLSGHYHHALAATAQGIPVVVAPGITNTSDALVSPSVERATIGSGFAVVDLPTVGDPRAAFVSVPGPGVGDEVFRLDAEAIARIADAAGVPT